MLVLRDTRAEDNLARKRIKKLHSLGLSSEEAEDIRHDSKCQYLDAEKGGKPCGRAVLGFRYCAYHIVKVDRIQLNRNRNAKDSDNPNPGLTCDPISGIGEYAYSKLGYGSGEAICYYHHTESVVPEVQARVVHETETDPDQISWSAYMEVSTENYNALVELTLSGSCIVRFHGIIKPGSIIKTHSKIF